MSISSLRLRRTTLSLSTFIFNHPITPLSSITPPHFTQTPQNPSLIIPNLVSQFRAFRVSNTSLARPRTGFNNNDDDMKFGPDEILFEGCDYNHWLITVDFPKDPKPSPQEMVDTYVKIAAMVFGCPEEAKKKIYACSTTTYQGFQVECSEAMSTKFEGLPGVVFILPDSYIDPVNKGYGGDKYDNGIITPRPPPMQYGRTGGRFGDGNRDFNRPSRPRGEFQQGNPAYDNRGSTQGSAGNFGPPPSPPPQQNYGPPRVAPMNNFPGGQENYQGYGRDQMSPNQGNYNQGQRGNSYPQGSSAPPGGLNNNAASPPQGGNFMQGAGGNYGQGASGSYNQGADVSYGQGAAGSYGQGGAGNYGQGGAGNYGQGVAGNYRQGASGYGHGAGNYGQGAGNYGQGAGGNFEQGATGSFGQGTGGAVSGQEKFPNYGQPNSVHGENQRFSQGEQMNDLRQVQQ